MIFLAQTTTGTPVYNKFSTKRVGAGVVTVKGLNEASEFCTCISQCIPDLKVFTDEVGTDFYKNDFTSFFIPTINTLLITGSTITGTITNVTTGTSTTLVNSTHGDLYVGNKYWWFKLDWYKIWLELGYGRYQIEVNEVGNYAGQTLNQLKSEIYTLKKYTDKEAQATVRIESFQSGKLQHGNNYSSLTTSSISIPFPFEQQTRLPGALTFAANEDETDHLVLNNAERSTLQVKDQIRPSYELKLFLVGNLQVSKVIFDELFGNEIYVTDYNVYNPVFDPRDTTAIQYKSIPVRRESTSFDVKRTRLKTTFTFGMLYEYDNVIKTNN
jgi:hypothetical protein